MKTRKFLAILVLAIGLVGSASADLPAGWSAGDIIPDAPHLSYPPGSASYDEWNDRWTVTTEKYTHFVYKLLRGDGHIIARIGSAGVDNAPQVAIREDRGSNSRHATMGIYMALARGRPSYWYPKFSYTSEVGSGSIDGSGDFRIDQMPCLVMIERIGNEFTGYISQDPYVEIPSLGEVSDLISQTSWTLVWSKQINMSTNTWIGLAVEGTGTFQFDKVDIKVDTGPGMSGPDNDWTVSEPNMYSAIQSNVGIGTMNPRAKLDVVGKIRISKSSGEALVELGEGLDYAEGFNVSVEKKITPGSVLIIDPANPGKLTISRCAYDRKVAGIVAGAKGLGSGVRLGVGQFDCNVALAGRVYCNVDATKVAVQPGDLLTTSNMPGYAMKAEDYARARGAILGKAMEKLEKGKKGQILVLVTLQ